MNKSAIIQLRAMKLVIIVGIIIMLIKFAAFVITHSNAILTDALESIINIVAGGFAYYSISLASKPKDLNHPYGHGKIEFISAGFEGGLILIAGISIIIKSVINFFHPAPIEQLGLGSVLAGTAGLINFLLGKYLVRVGNEHRSLTLQADGKHLVSDTYSSIGMIIGLVIIQLTGMLWLDSVLAILFGIIIMVTGYNLFRKSLAGLMDEADTSILQELVRILNQNRTEKWIDIHNLRVLQFGSYYHIDCHITLPWYDDLLHSHDELKKIENLVHEQLNNKVELFIHPDPCMPFSCSICQLSHCTVRQKPFEKKVEWELDNLLRNEKHHVS